MLLGQDGLASLLLPSWWVESELCSSSRETGPGSGPREAPPYGCLAGLLATRESWAGGPGVGEGPREARDLTLRDPGLSEEPGLGEAGAGEGENWSRVILTLALAHTGPHWLTLTLTLVHTDTGSHLHWLPRSLSHRTAWLCRGPQ